MSQEIQLANQTLPLQPAVLPTMLAPAGPIDATPLMRMHRLLRGRYGLAVVLALIGAACGVAAGIMLPKPAWESVGLVRVNPAVPSPHEMDPVTPLHDQIIANVMVELKAERTIRQAMTNADWKAHRPFPGDMPPPEQVIEFTKNLTVKQVANAPQMIQVTYDDSRKDGKDVAQIAVSAVINAYHDLWGTHEFSDELQRKIDLARKDMNNADLLLGAAQAKLDALTQEVGDSEGAVLGVREGNKLSLQHSLAEAQHLMTQSQQDMERHQAGMKAGHGYTAEDIATVDTMMAARLTGLITAKIELEMAAANEGERNRDYVTKRSNFELRQADINREVDRFNETYFIETRTDGSAPFKVPKDFNKLRQLVAQLTAEIKKEDDNIQELHTRFATINHLKADADRLRAERDENQRLIHELEFQKAMGGQFQVIDEGSIPQPASDRRPVFAALGFLGGAAVPIGLLMLLGLANPRYRFSDEASTDTSGLNLLGILPDLPDRLSDPEQASIAAHCVHQIRTMLQISGGPEERRVFAVTSAAPGDGKTSLTLALGLSYAACGTRTLLIDCDLVGAGLTARMNVSSPEGVLEAIANRSLAEYVRGTDVADVSILPVGAAQTLHASTLSPAALRRLIDEARKQYDTILIDTGPILGSIEASLVCAAADAVVLTVARGQQRPLVERAINHLTGIGAKVAGVVFNRAQSNDFDRSISGVSSLRSVSSGNGHNGHEGPRYGTLGRAVHSNSRRADINEG